MVDDITSDLDATVIDRVWEVINDLVYDDQWIIEVIDASDTTYSTEAVDKVKRLVRDLAESISL